MEGRREERAAFLSPEMIKMEMVLLSRAEQLEETKAPGLDRVIAHELRKLAEELHYW